MFKRFVKCRVLVARNSGINGGKSLIKAWVNGGFVKKEVVFHHEIIEDKKQIGTMIYLKNGQVFHTDLIKID